MERLGMPVPGKQDRAMSESARPAIGARPPFLDVDFSKSPFTLAWEITRACGLACIHGGAEAQPRRDPRELTTEEGFDLIDQVVEIGKPILVVTGGAPLLDRHV